MFLAQRLAGDLNRLNAATTSPLANGGLYPLHACHVERSRTRLLGRSPNNLMGESISGD